MGEGEGGALTTHGPCLCGRSDIHCAGQARVAHLGACPTDTAEPSTEPRKEAQPPQHTLISHVPKGEHSSQNEIPHGERTPRRHTPRWRYKGGRAGSRHPIEGDTPKGGNGASRRRCAPRTKPPHRGTPGPTSTSRGTTLTGTKNPLHPYGHSHPA